MIRCNDAPWYGTSETKILIHSHVTTTIAPCNSDCMRKMHDWSTSEFSLYASHDTNVHPVAFHQQGSASCNLPMSTRQICGRLLTTIRILIALSDQKRYTKALFSWRGAAGWSLTRGGGLGASPNARDTWAIIQTGHFHSDMDLVDTVLRMHHPLVWTSLRNRSNSA